MIINHVKIQGFRNLESVEFIPDEKYNIIAGRNAQGKTNLIEAMWIMSGCRSFRGSKEKDYIPINDNKMSSEINITDSARNQKICFEMTKGTDCKKVIHLNGVKQKGTKPLFDVFKCIAFIPDDTEIVRGTPEKRRCFTDMAYSQINPMAVSHLNRHNVIMNQRNALLKEIMQGNAPPDLLEIIDQQEAREGAYISFMRNDYIRKINKICGRLYQEISGGTEKLELEYKSNVYKAEDFEKLSTKQAEDLYFKKLRESADYDIRTGTTHTGVNRDDVIIRINGMSAKEYGSQGQVKSTALVMKLAQAEIFMKKSKESPVIFLDDVMGELDEKRQKFIFGLIGDMQVFITTCNENAILPEIKAKVIYIDGGKITEETENVSAYRE
ncbi:MAG: DNA replication and repair protein RecF [Ruminococcus sp.]|nr:DNA replication and repair protein RecF [Ruminococcus sp.]